MFTKIAAIIETLKLKKHQQEGLDKSEASGGSLILDWKPGAGKTAGSMAIFERLREKGKAKTALIVAPSQLKSNYHQNLKKYSDSSSVIIGNSQEKHLPDTVYHDNIPEGKDYYIISNEMWRQNPQYYLNKTKADTVVLDEIQKYKDPNSLNYKQMMSVRGNFKNMIGLTGTPISNHPRDIIPLVDLITNKKHSLGKYSDFNKNYINEKKKHYGPLGFIGIGPTGTETSLKNKDKLKSELNKYIHSYHDEDPDMPKKMINEIEVPMSTEQAEVYNWVMHKHINPLTRLKVQYNLPVGKSEATNMFSALMQARQASNAMHLFKRDMSLGESAEKTPKVKQLLDDVKAHLESDNKNKAIIYSNFYHGGVDVLSEGLKTRGLKHGIYAGSGKVNLSDRKKGVDDYLAGKHRVMVLNSAGAEGLNLPGTTAHFQLDGHFNPALQEQAEARGIRTGSPVDHVDVKRYKTVMPNTAIEDYLGANFKALKAIKGYSTDEWVYETAKRKQYLNNQIQELMNSNGR